MVRRYYSAYDLETAFHLSHKTEGKTLRRWASGARTPSPRQQRQIHRLARDLQRVAGFYRDPTGGAGESLLRVSQVRLTLWVLLRGKTGTARHDTLFRLIDQSLHTAVASSPAQWEWAFYEGGGRPLRRTVRFFEERGFALVGFTRFTHNLEVLELVLYCAYMMDVREFEHALATLLAAGPERGPKSVPAGSKLRTELLYFQEEAQRLIRQKDGSA